MNTEQNSRSDLITTQIESGEPQKSTPEGTIFKRYSSSIQEHYLSRPHIARRLARRSGSVGMRSGIFSRAHEVFLGDGLKLLHGKEGVVHAIVEFVSKITP